MASKTTKVTLACALYKSEFDIEVAERLLSWKQSGWTLADDRYAFSEGVLTKKQKTKRND